MYPIIIILSLTVTALLVVKHLRNQPAAARRSLMIRYLGYTLIGLIIILALTGRIHWLGAAIAALIPVIGKLATWGLRLLPFLQQWRKHKHANHRYTSNKSPTATTMNYQEALALFGLSSTAAVDKQKIIQRHRQLMQKNHPDRGGSDYLASKINEAKKILLQAIEK